MFCTQFQVVLTRVCAVFQYMKVQYELNDMLCTLVVLYKCFMCLLLQRVELGSLIRVVK